MSNKNVDDLIQMMNSILQNVNKEKKDEILSGKLLMYLFLFSLSLNCF